MSDHNYSPSEPVLDLDVLKRIAAGIANLFSPYCEVVIHDFSDLEHSIVHIEGNISGRSIGGAATDLLVNCVLNEKTQEDPTNYLTTLPQGRVMKSSTVFLHDENGKTRAAFCINIDISPFVNLQNQLGQFLLADEHNNTTELLSDDLRETFQSLVAQTLYEMGDSQPIMDRDTRVELIRRLDDKGIFQITKAVPLLAELLGLSRATVYNYLRDARLAK